MNILEHVVFVFLNSTIILMGLTAVFLMGLTADLFQLCVKVICQLGGVISLSVSITYGFSQVD